MRFTIGQKLALGFGGILLLMVICCLVVFQALERINAAAQKLNDRAIPTMNAADELLIAVNWTTSVTRGMLVLGKDSRVGQDFEKDAITSIENVRLALNELKKLNAEKDNVVDTDAYQRIVTISADYLDSQTQVRKAVEASKDRAESDVQEAISLMENYSVPKSRELRHAAQDLRENTLKQMVVIQDELENHRQSAKWILLISTSMALILGTIVAVALTRSFSRTLHALLVGVRLVSKGVVHQEDIPVTSTDEVGELTIGFNQMVDSLRDVLSEVNSATKEVASASGQISTGAQQQLTSLNETAASLNEITTSAEEFKATMQEFADRAKAVHEAADETARRASEGLSLSRDSTTRIEKVQENSLSAAGSVLHLAEQMQRIGEITASVNEIAEQTKLLALNASIEAARAGEDGRGFAVVAMQVRELANQSKDAASRIESLITQTQKSVQNVVSRIEEGGRLSEDSTSKVRLVSTAFEEIAKAIEQTRQAMAQINTGARQQELGITELVSSIVEIDSASKESVAAAEQTRQAIQAIDDRLQSLDELVGRFKLS